MLWTLTTTLFSTPALADTWELDPAHSRVGFGVTHLMVSTVEGRFPAAQATLDYEVGAVRDLEVTVDIDVASIDTNNEQRDEHLRSADFFDVAQFPAITFRSTGVKASRKGFEIAGDLTIKGVTKRVTLKGTGLEAAVTDPWGNQRVGATATTTVNRKDFGLTWNQTLETGGVLVGDDVELRLQVEFIKKAD